MIMRIPTIALFGLLACLVSCTSAVDEPGDDGIGDSTNDDGDTGDTGGDDGADGEVPPCTPFTQGPLENGLATLAGGPTAGEVDGQRDCALFFNPVNLLVLPNGDLLVADFNNSLIRKVSPAGQVTTFSQPPEEGMFVRPFGLALHEETLLVQTDGNSRGVPGGALWQLFLDDGVPRLLYDDLGKNRGLVMNEEQEMLYLSNQQRHHITRLSPGGAISQVFVGDIEGQPGYLDGQNNQARFNEPYGLAQFEEGFLVADSGNHAIRRVGFNGIVSTFAGSPLQGDLDGPAQLARFNRPQAVAVGPLGVYVADTGNGKIKLITDGQVITIAGSTPGFADNINANQGQLFGLEGMACTESFCYIADGNRGLQEPYNRVRRLTL